MRLIRTSVIVVVAVVLLAVAVPAVQARSIEKPQPVLHSLGGSWLDVALSWLERLAGSEPPAPAVARAKASTSNPPPGTGSSPGPVKVPETGGCIDPLGTGRCNI